MIDLHIHSVYSDGTCTIDEIIDIAKECEAVDAVPVVHGHWKAYPECGATRCSVCDWSIEEAWWSNYCPLCGAKMDDGGVQDEN